MGQASALVQGVPHLAIFTNTIFTNTISTYTIFHRLMGEFPKVEYGSSSSTHAYFT